MCGAYGKVPGTDLYRQCTPFAFSLSSLLPTAWNVDTMAEIQQSSGVMR